MMQFGSGYLLREYTSREAKLSEMKVGRQDWPSMNPLIHSPPSFPSSFPPPPSLLLSPPSLCACLHLCSDPPCTAHGR